MRGILESAGIEGNKICFLIEDHHLCQSEFLEMLNSLISSGEIPGLFKPEEMEGLFSQASVDIERDVGQTLYQIFIERVQSNLKIAISLDFTNPDFEKNCASNPALFTKCDIIWMNQWVNASM